MSEGRLRVAIAGAGGMGREALAWLRDALPDVDPVAFFVIDASERPAGSAVDLPVATTMEDLRALDTDGLVLGIGDVGRRELIAGEAESAGLRLVEVVHPTSFCGPGVVVASGALVAPGCVVTRDVRIGRGAIVNYGARLGHDSVIGDFAFVGPGTVLSGDVHIERGAYLGAASVILPGVKVGRNARVGAGAVVVSSVSEGLTVVGVPARVVGFREK